ncbi:phosphatidylinositol 4-OH kinase beta2 [Actinidia rufa]|uniref:Phosphatidylinositol 4-OH kinase beta2 n=1 Tax=Actinidia rufa TaxID=165716 RepID=A0A7J0ENG5_9ERIC|nr:phosphatidylinositol 4-OH kinase beta2 [Actinidia rufa]
MVKDRHNGNLFSAPFKLTRELLEVMDSDAEGIPSEFFDYFKVLCIQGFLTCRGRLGKKKLYEDCLGARCAGLGMIFRVNEKYKSIRAFMGLSCEGCEMAFLLSGDGVLMLKAYERRRKWIDQNYWSENGREAGMFHRMAMARGVLWRGTRGAKCVISGDQDGGDNWHLNVTNDTGPTTMSEAYGPLGLVPQSWDAQMTHDPVINWHQVYRVYGDSEEVVEALKECDRDSPWVEWMTVGFGHRQGRPDGFTPNFQDHGTCEKSFNASSSPKDRWN